MKILSIILIILFTNSCSLFSKKQVAFKSDNSIDFKLHDNRIFVDVLINEKGPFKFIFDTGGSNIITPEVAKALKLKKSKNHVTLGAGNKKVVYQKTNVKKLKLGSTTVKNQKFKIISLNEIKSAFNFKKLDGVIGYEVLMKNIVAISYENKKIFLNPTFPKFPYFSKGENGKAFLFKMKYKKPIITGSIDNNEAKLLLDTGDRSALTLFIDFAVRTGLKNKFKDKFKKLTGVGAGGEVYARVADLNLELLDKYSFDKVKTRLPVGKKSFYTKSRKISASVGNEILKRFEIVLDYKNKQIVLFPNKNYDKKIKFRKVPNPKF